MELTVAGHKDVNYLDDIIVYREIILDDLPWIKVDIFMWATLTIRTKVFHVHL